MPDWWQAETFERETASNRDPISRHHKALIFRPGFVRRGLPHRRRAGPERDLDLWHGISTIDLTLTGVPVGR